MELSRLHSIPNSPAQGAALGAHPHSHHCSGCVCLLSDPSRPDFEAFGTAVSLPQQHIPGGPVSKALLPTPSPPQALQPRVQQTLYPYPGCRVHTPLGSWSRRCELLAQQWLFSHPNQLRRRARSHSPWGGPQLGLAWPASVPLATQYTNASLAAHRRCASTKQVRRAAGEESRVEGRRKSAEARKEKAVGRIQFNPLHGVRSDSVKSSVGPNPCSASHISPVPRVLTQTEQPSFTWSFSSLLIFRDAGWQLLWNASTEEALSPLPSPKLFGEQVSPSQGSTPQRAWKLHGRCEYSPSLGWVLVPRLSKDTQVLWNKNSMGFLIFRVPT